MVLEIKSEESIKFQICCFCHPQFLILQEATQPVSTSIPKHTDRYLKNVNVVLIQVGKGRSHFFITFSSNTKNARIIPDHQLIPATKDPFVAAKEFFAFKLHAVITHNGGAKAIPFAGSQAF